jgi:hypothetical protein
MTILKKIKQITPKNVHAFVQAHYRKYKDELGDLEPHIKEQVLWRSVKAKACTENKSCLYCGCSTEDLELYFADLGCKKPEDPCYPNMMDKESWENYKKENEL